jgi:hypothetical protein
VDAASPPAFGVLRAQQEVVLTQPREQVPEQRWPENDFSSIDLISAKILCPVYY